MPLPLKWEDIILREISQAKPTNTLYLHLRIHFTSSGKFAFRICGHEVKLIYLMQYIYFFNLEYLFIFIVVPIYPHLSPLSHPPPPPTLNLNPPWFCPCVFYTCSLTTLPLLSPVNRLPLSLWLLSMCSLFQ